MCEEQLRGVLVRLLDVTLHADSIHRGAGQILPTARRVTFASMILGQPMLMEPIYNVEIQTQASEAGGIYGVISQRRGNVVAENPVPGSPIVVMKAHVPVAESFGLTATLRAATGGKAFPQASFSHWALLQFGDPYQAGSKANELIVKIRTRKGLDKPQPSPLNEWYDKL